MGKRNACSAGQFYLVISMVGGSHSYDGSHIHTTDESYFILQYQPSTGTDILQKHLYTYHVDAWVEGCDKFGIEITAQKAQHAVDQYRQDTGSQTTATGGQAKTKTGPASKPYSPEAFIDALVEWIVADNQVISQFL